MSRVDLGRLETFLRALPSSVRHAVEFRHEAWYTGAVCDRLDAYGAAFCEHDLVGRPVPRPTGGFRYLRFHGTRGRYRGRYGRQALSPVAKDLRRWRGLGHDAFVYFNNDTEGHALYDAVDLSGLLGGRPTLDLPAPS